MKNTISVYLRDLIQCWSCLDIKKIKTTGALDAHICKLSPLIINYIGKIVTHGNTKYVIIMSIMTYMNIVLGL